MKHVVFKVEAEEFAISVDKVLSIEVIPHIRTVPTTNEHVRGLANMRGNVITVMDMNSIIHHRPIEVGPESRLLILAETQTGYLVNQASDIIDIVEEELGAFEGNELVKGVWKSGEERLILVVDVNKLVAV